MSKTRAEIELHAGRIFAAGNVPEIMPDEQTAEYVELCRILLHEWNRSDAVKCVAAVGGLAGEFVRGWAESPGKVLLWDRLPQYRQILAALDGNDYETYMFRTAMQITNAAFAFDGSAVAALTVTAVAMHGEPMLNRILMQSLNFALQITSRLTRDSRSGLESIVTGIDSDPLPTGKAT